MTPTEIVDVSHLPAVPIRVRCECGTRTIPVWQVSDTLTALRKHLLGKLDPDIPVLTWRCQKCKFTVEITAQMLHLAEPNTNGGRA